MLWSCMDMIYVFLGSRGSMCQTGVSASIWLWIKVSYITSLIFCKLWTCWMCWWFRPPSATAVSAEPFSHGPGTLRCLQKEMATYRQWSVSLWRDPDDVKHCGACRRKWRLTDTDLMSLWRDPLDVSHCQILFPDKTEWRLSSATLCGWKRCFVADQLW